MKPSFCSAVSLPCLFPADSPAGTADLKQELKCCCRRTDLSSTILYLRFLCQIHATDSRIDGICKNSLLKLELLPEQADNFCIRNGAEADGK